MFSDIKFLFRASPSQIKLTPSHPSELSAISSIVNTVLASRADAMAPQLLAPSLFRCIPSQLLKITLVMAEWTWSMLKKAMQPYDVRSLLPKSICTIDLLHLSPLISLFSPSFPIWFFRRSNLANASLFLTIPASTPAASAPSPSSLSPNLRFRMFLRQYSKNLLSCSEVQWIIKSWHFAKFRALNYSSLIPGILAPSTIKFVLCVVVL